MIDRKKLRELVEAATPGKWIVGNASDAIIVEGTEARCAEPDCSCQQYYGGSLIGESLAPQNRDYIVAANPTAILALLDDLDAKDARIEKLRRHIVYQRYADEAARQAAEDALAADDEAAKG